MTKRTDFKTLHKIIKYYYIDSLTQREIAEKLNVSRIKVIRYLDYAKAEGLVEIKLNIPLKNSFELESAVEKNYSLKECRIVPSFSNSNDFYKYAGVELSDILKRLLKKGGYVGVSWSQTFRNTLEYADIGKKLFVNVVPIIGGLELDGSVTNSNIIAHIFAEKIGGVNFTINIPAVLDSREAKDIIEEESHTKKIKNMAEKIDVVITGVGNIGVDSTALRNGYFTPGEIKYLNSLKIHGIINLSFIDGNGKEVKTDIDNRIVKILPLKKIKELENVVGIAFGKNKVKPLKAALQGRIIKYLVTDEDTAKALIK